MIDTCRTQIVEEDASVIADILCTTEKDREPLLDLLRTDPGIRDDILDDPRLVSAVMEISDKSTLSPRLYFYIGIRHFLCKRQLNDKDLADYLSTMCTHFLFDTAWGTNNPMMHPDAYINRVVDILADAVDDEDWNRAWCLHSHLGHYLLFFTGLLPKVLVHLGKHSGMPTDKYESIGRHHFKQASNFDVPRADYCAKLHREFPTIRKCLNELSISSFL
jgi:hypothetical protein